MFRLRWLLPLLLFACSPDKAMNSLMRPGEKQAAEQLLNQVAQGNRPAPGTLEPNLDEELAPHLGELRAQLPPAPVRLKLLQYGVVVGNERFSTATYELSGRGRFAVAQVVSREKDGQRAIVGLHAQRLPGPAMAQNPFTLEGKTVGHYAMLVAMVAAVGITVAALFRIWRSGLFRRRILWTIGAIVSVGTVALNWTSGEWLFQPLSFQLFGAGFLKQPLFAPWIMKVSVPLFAIAALLIKRGREYRIDEPSET